MAEAARLNRLEAALRGAAAALTARRWALVGGLAISARGEPRFTPDIDLAVVVSSDADAEALVHALLPAGYRVIATAEHEEQRRLATARLAVPGEQTGGVVVDLLFASSGIEAELVAAATPPVADPAEVARARASVQLIQARGFHRGRRLDADLEALLSTRP
jgi:hypothetical protein